MLTGNFSRWNRYTSRFLINYGLTQRLWHSVLFPSLQWSILNLILNLYLWLLSSPLQWQLRLMGVVVFRTKIIKLTKKQDFIETVEILVLYLNLVFCPGSGRATTTGQILKNFSVDSHGPQRMIMIVVTLWPFDIVLSSLCILSLLFTSLPLLYFIFYIIFHSFFFIPIF